MIKPKIWKKMGRSGLNVSRGTSISTVVSSSGEFVDTRKNSNPEPELKYPVSMLSPIGSSTLKMMSIRSIGRMARAIYMRTCFTTKYRGG